MAADLAADLVKFGLFVLDKMLYIELRKLGTGELNYGLWKDNEDDGGMECV